MMTLGVFHLSFVKVFCVASKSPFFSCAFFAFVEIEREERYQTLMTF